MPGQRAAAMRYSGPAAILVGAALLLAAAPAHAAYLPANADFNDDGFSDLAVGAPADDVERQDSAGAVNVLYGGPNGLGTRGEQQFTQATRGVGDDPEAGDRFGETVAAGDFDGDGTGDLAIGVPGEGVARVGSEREAAGMVQVLYGSRDGLRTAGGDSWTQDTRGIRGVVEARDGFGSALAVGDFDGDGSDDLGVGVPGDSVGASDAAGAVNAIYGGGGGLTQRGDQLWTQDSPGIKGLAGTGFQMGSSLAANDVSANGRDELAIGIPGGRISGHPNAGAVLVLYGRSGGLSSVDDLWSQDARGVKAFASPGDRFGNALAIGDFDRDGIGDLAVGVPAEDVARQADAGAVNVLYGSGTGLRSDPDQLWTRNSPGIKGVALESQRFGNSLVGVDFSGNVADDLAIGVPGAAVDGAAFAGEVNVLYGNARRGLGERADQIWSQNTRGINGVAGERDGFGATLTAGDFDADNFFDLVVGVPGETISGVQGAGAVNVIHGSTFGVREDPDRLWSQGSPGVSGAVGQDSFGVGVISGSR